MTFNPNLLQSNHYKHERMGERKVKRKSKREIESRNGNEERRAWTTTNCHNFHHIITLFSLQWTNHILNAINVECWMVGLPTVSSGSISFSSSFRKCSFYFSIVRYVGRFDAALFNFYVVMCFLAFNLSSLTLEFEQAFTSFDCYIVDYFDRLLQTIECVSQSVQLLFFFLGRFFSFLPVSSNGKTKNSNRMIPY